MAKIILSDIASLIGNPLSSQNTINSNNQALRDALDKALFRDGTGPNQMLADIDLNGNSLLNVADPVDDSDGVNLRSVRPLVEQYAGEIAETIIVGTQRVEVFTATAGQTDFVLQESPGTVANMLVTDSGIVLTPGVDYTLGGVGMKTLSMFVGRTLNTEVVCRYQQLAPSDGQLRADLTSTASGNGAGIVQYTPPSTSVAGTVRSFLDSLWDSTGGTLLRWIQAGTGAVAVTIAAELGRIVRPEQYGGVGDGVTDDTAAINAAIAYLNSIGWSKPLYLGSKLWKVTASLTAITGDASPHIVGDGARIIVSHATGDVITFYSGSGGAQIQNAKVSGIEFTAGVTRTAGAAVRGLNVADMRVESCTFKNQYTGIKVGVYQYPTVHDCMFSECVAGIELDQGSGGTISNCRAQTGSGTTPTPGTTGLLLTNASGVMVVNTDLVRCEWGIKGIPGVGAAVQFLFLVNTLCDTCEYGMQLSTSSGGTVSAIFVTNSWFSSCKQNGLYASGVKNLRITDSEVIVNRREGINLISCEQVRVRGGMIGWNNVDDTATGSGIIASGCAGLSIRDTLFTNKSGWTSYGAVQNQKYALQLATVATSDVAIVGCSMVDHDLGDVLASVTPTGTSRIFGNITTRTSAIASATNIAVEPMHDFHTVTGTTTVQNITAPAFGNQIIHLRTVDGCTIQDGFNFKLQGNFVGTANSVLSLMSVPGTGWVEVGRAII